MADIKVTVNADGYVINFATTGDLLSDSIQVQAINFDALNYDCYKVDNGVLVWDDDKYQQKINPTPIEPQPSELDVLKQRTEDLELMLTEIILGGM